MDIENYQNNDVRYLWNRECIREEEYALLCACYKYYMMNVMYTVLSILCIINRTD